MSSSEEYFESSIEEEELIRKKTKKYKNQDSDEEDRKNQLPPKKRKRKNSEEYSVQKIIDVSSSSSSSSEVVVTKKPKKKKKSSKTKKKSTEKISTPKTKPNKQEIEDTENYLKELNKYLHSDENWTEWCQEMSEKDYEKLKASFTEEDNKRFKKRLEEYWLIIGPDKSKISMIDNILSTPNNPFWPFLLEVFKHKPARDVCYYYRSVLSYYYSQRTAWTRQDIEKLAKLRKMLPDNWKRIGNELARDWVHCKNSLNTFIQLKNEPWSPEEEKLFLDFIFHHSLSSSITVLDIPFDKIKKLFPNRSMDCIILKWQIDLWPIVYERMLSTANWEKKDSEYLLIKISLQNPSFLSDINFSRLSNLWDPHTLQEQFFSMVKSIPNGYVLPVQLVLSRLLNDYHLDLAQIKSTKKKDDFKSW